MAKVVRPAPTTWDLSPSLHDSLTKRSCNILVTTWEMFFFHNASETYRNNRSSWNLLPFQQTLCLFIGLLFIDPSHRTWRRWKAQTAYLQSIDPPVPVKGLAKNKRCCTLYTHILSNRKWWDYSTIEKIYTLQWTDFFFMFPDFFGCQIGWVLHRGPLPTPGWRTLGAAAIQSLPHSALRTPSATDSIYQSELLAPNTIHKGTWKKSGYFTFHFMSSADGQQLAVVSPKSILPSNLVKMSHSVICCCICVLGNRSTFPTSWTGDCHVKGRFHWTVLGRRLFESSSFARLKLSKIVAAHFWSIPNPLSTNHTGYNRDSFSYLAWETAWGGTPVKLSWIDWPSDAASKVSAMPPTLSRWAGAQMSWPALCIIIDGSNLL